MPYINIKLTGNRLSSPQRQELLALITGLMDSVMNKQRDVTVVSLEQSSPDHWAIGGNVLGPDDHTAAYVDIKVTAGTNTPEQKARMIASTIAALKASIGDIQIATYVVIHDIAANCWGYDGQTQAARQGRTS